MTFHLCVYTMQSLFSSLLYPLPPPLFATPILFFFTIILPPSLYPSFLTSPLLLPTFPLSSLLPLPSSPPSSFLPSLLSLPLLPPLSLPSSPSLPLQAGANMIVSGKGCWTVE